MKQFNSGWHIPVKKVLAVALFISLHASPVSAEYLMLTDGSIVEGTITNTSPVGYTVKTSDGNTVLVVHNRLVRTVYTSDFMSRKYIYLADGSMIEGFIVEESRAAYTVRKELTGQQETVIQKSKVLSVTGQKAQEKKISRLAVADFKAVDIPAADAEKISDNLRTELTAGGYYIVLSRSQMKDILKEKGGGSVACHDSGCAEKTGVLLSVNYVLIGTVTAEGNGFKIKARMIDSAGGGEIFSSEASAGTREQLKPAVKKIADDLNKKIEARRIREDIKDVMMFSVSADYVYAASLGSMKQLSQSGMGGSVTFSLDLYRSYNIGLTAGYIYFKGAQIMTDSMAITPVALTAGYYLYPVNYLYLKPFIITGGAIVTLSQDIDGVATGGTPKYLSSSALEFLSGAGAEIGFINRGSVVIKAGGSYNMIVESGGTMSYTEFHCGAGYRF